ncbi:hypothetical protein [Nocardia neocaledoniensis]|uniref:hypothetical protein n=1 Tax=Nocardia neocaledoniensis TaxID=236511 RepID=UPI0024590827|nr:hypothetical protein [Nocardia neocaledoniensis]
MVALQIRDVPEPLRAPTGAPGPPPPPPPRPPPPPPLAQRRGQSLQAFLFDLIRDEACRQDNIAVLKQYSPATWDVSFSARDVEVALDAERAERDSALEPGDRRG